MEPTSFWMGTLFGFAMFEWGLMLLVLLAVIATVAERASYFLGFLGLIALASYSEYGFRALTPLVENPLATLTAVFAYVLVGGLWSTFKWYKVGRSWTERSFAIKQDYCKSMLKDLKKFATATAQGKNFQSAHEREEYAKMDKLVSNHQLVDSYIDVLSRGEVPPNFVAHFNQSYEVRSNRKRPVASEHKDRIASWIVFFPLSMFGYLLGEFLLDLFKQLWKLVGGIYDAITRKATAEIDDTLFR